MAKPKGYYTDKRGVVRPIMGKHTHIKPLSKGTKSLRIPKRNFKIVAKRVQTPKHSKRTKPPNVIHYGKPNIYPYFFKAERGKGDIFISGTFKTKEAAKKAAQTYAPKAEPPSKVRIIDRRKIGFQTPQPLTWREFNSERMGPYMKKYGGHGPAIRQIAKEWKTYKETHG